MKLTSALFIFLLISCSKNEMNTSEKVTPEVSFVKTIGGTNNEVALSIAKTSDNGYIILGYTQSNDYDIISKTNTSFDYYVLKFSSEDVLEWSKTYGGTSDDRGQNIIQTQDGGFAILGYTKSSDIDVTTNAGDLDFWFIKLNNTGTIIWQKTYGYQGKDDGVKLMQTNDGGYLIAGELDVTASGGEGNFSKANHAGGDYWVLKLNNLGGIEWSNYYGGNFTDIPQGIVATSNGGYMIAGTSDSSDVDITNNKGSYDFWVINISNTGELIWEQNYGGTEIDEAKSITNTSDGNFIIIGNTRSNDKDVTINNGGADLWVVKIDPNGGLLWEKTYGGSSFDVGRSITKTIDGGYLISGSSRSLDNGFTNQGQNDAWLLKISSEGNEEWQKIIGGSDIDFLYDAIELEDGSFIAIGESSSNDGYINTNKGFSDLLIIKLK